MRARVLVFATLLALSQVSTGALLAQPAPTPAPAAQSAADDAARARGAELVRTVVGPALRAWSEAHADQWAPTPEEIDRMAAWMAEASQCPGREPPPPLDPQARREVAAAFVKGPKMQRYLQRTFGGERVLWQQFGTEAFDATYRLIQALEKEGKIRFASAADRALALDYWTRDQGAWLSPYKSDAESFPLLYDAPPCPQG